MHRKDEDAARVVDLLCARPRCQVFDIKEDVQAGADLATALLDELADVLAKRPRVWQEQANGQTLSRPGAAARQSRHHGRATGAASAADGHHR
eukprot:2626019-Prymnesium_polylepis.1